MRQERLKRKKDTILLKEKRRIAKEILYGTKNIIQRHDQVQNFAAHHVFTPSERRPRHSRFFFYTLMFKIIQNILQPFSLKYCNGHNKNVLIFI